MERDLFRTRLWIQVALINFCVVALAGITMRYKINFPLPLINQKYLLYAHSHFAFDGWVALALMTSMVNYLQQRDVITNYKKYYLILLAHCIAAYGMFFSFMLEGYAFFSITFSTISIFISYFFIFYLWRDLNKIKGQSHHSKWFKASLVLWGLSSLGAFALAYLMANHIKVQDYYFAAIYFFLHFQYNGWFLFACFGLLFSYLSRKDYLPAVATIKKLFIIMAITVAPAFFLSVLWLKLPEVLVWIGRISGVLQLLVLFYFIRLFPVLKRHLPHKFTKLAGYLWIMASIAFIIKIILQMLSVIPFFSHYAFGFRPVVIGYLHLSFLGIISFFLLGYINEILREVQHRLSKTGVLVFVTGVLIQEIILMCQGLEAIEVEPLPHANIILFYAAIIMGTGLIWITVSMSKKQFDL